MLTEHTKLKELCLENGNPEAHYIEGILQYFVKERKHAGLRHLRLSSILNNSNGTFLYGLLMLVHGHYHKDQELANDDQDNEDLQGNIDEFSELESECSSQESLDTDTSDDEQPSIDLEQGKDNQADRVKFLADLFRKHFSAPKPKLKPLSRKEDGSEADVGRYRRLRAMKEGMVPTGSPMPTQQPLTRWRGAVERGYLLASEEVLMEICITEELVKLKKHSKTLTRELEEDGRFIIGSDSGSSTNSSPPHDSDDDPPDTGGVIRLEDVTDAFNKGDGAMVDKGKAIMTHNSVGSMRDIYGQGAGHSIGGGIGPNSGTLALMLGE
ncbi:hypothetical protein Bca52824_031054 [Brassica carinata]|uniref:At2g35280-like TPR domain-containing protein n=1 Tax=Brassica carinata TaxID=52824 RepID=A0A8X7SAB1_BRACI|nr:hypothetical protein Bca52824_031054 [Brassica carinata]